MGEFLHKTALGLWAYFLHKKSNHEKSHLSHLNLNSACELKCAKIIVRGDVLGVQILCLLWALIKKGLPQQTLGLPQQTCCKSCSGRKAEIKSSIVWSLTLSWIAFHLHRPDCPERWCFAVSGRDVSGQSCRRNDLMMWADPPYQMMVQPTISSSRSNKNSCLDF